MAYSERELLARVIRCEAGGEGENGMKACACVIMNRVTVPAGEYQRVGQGSLRRILNQPGQFDCMTSVLRGRPNPQTIWANPPEEVHFQIADWAMAGNKFPTTGYALWYFNPFNPSCPGIFPRNGNGYYVTRIGEHCFYNPAQSYYLT